VAASAVIPVVMMKLRRLIMWPPLSKEPIMVSSFGGSPRRIVAARGEQLARQAPGFAREFFLDVISQTIGNMDVMAGAPLHSLPKYSN